MHQFSIGRQALFGSDSDFAVVATRLTYEKLIH
jgi:hypothetical protein